MKQQCAGIFNRKITVMGSKKWHKFFWLKIILSTYIFQNKQKNWQITGIRSSFANFSLSILQTEKWVNLCKIQKIAPEYVFYYDIVIYRYSFLTKIRHKMQSIWAKIELKKISANLGQMQKNGHNSAVSGPRPKPFGVQRSFIFFQIYFKPYFLKIISTL